MKAVLKRVGEPAVEIDTDLTYKFMSDTVGGYIQMVPIGPDIDVVCNEEGMFADDGKPLPQNAAGFLGNLLIVATDPEEGENRDMTPEEVRKALSYLNTFAEVEHPMHTDGPLTDLIVGKKEVDTYMQDKTANTLNLWNTL